MAVYCNIGPCFRVGLGRLNESENIRSAKGIHSIMEVRVPTYVRAGLCGRVFYFPSMLEIILLRLVLNLMILRSASSSRRTMTDLRSLSFSPSVRAGASCGMRLG